MTPCTARPNLPRRVTAGLLSSALMALSGLAAQPAFGAPADLDGGFGSSGLVTTPVGSGTDAGVGVAVQQDGRIVVAGSSSNGTDNDFAVVRYTASGALDPSFGSGGKVVTSFGQGAEDANGVAIQSDGRIVVAGKAGTSMAVARYLPDGTLDTGFDGDGRVLTNYAAGTDDTARAVAIAPGGRIVVAGNTFNGVVHMAVAIRYNADGSLDTTLDGDGKLVAINPDSATQDVVADGVTVLPDGRISLTGGTGAGCLTGTGACRMETSRWTAAGAVDVTFDKDGESSTTIGSFAMAHAIAIQADGRTVVAGVGQPGVNRQIALARFTAENGASPGNLDKSFDTDGWVTTAVGVKDEAFGIALQSDGKIIVSGSTVSAGGVHSFVLLRYTSTGAPDTTFGTQGSVTTTFPGANADGRSIAVGPDGRWVVAGTANGDFALARYVGQLSGRSLSAGDSSGVEGGSVIFTVNLSSVDSVPVTVHYATADGTAKAGSDYVAASGDLTFGPGETSKTVAVSLIGDSVADSGETFSLDLSGVTPADTLVLKSQLFGTIYDSGHGEVGCLASCPTGGYWMVATDGGIFSYGSAKFFGSTGAIRLNKPIVGMSTTPGRQGYWLVASDGGIFSYGDAKFHGSTGNIVLNKPIVGMTTTPSGNGYWMVATDGGIFAFGDAKFFGSTGNIRLNKPIVGMTSTPDGGGYWLVASDGGIFAFGNAKFQGSTGNITLAKPITAMTSTKSGNGYWMTATDGGIFAFGDATFFGSTGGQTLPRPIVAMSTSPSGNGYLMAGADGSVYNFGDANKIGELRGQPLAKPIVGMTSF